MANIFISKDARVEAGCTIGDGTKIWHWTHIMPGAVIGENCMIGSFVSIASNSRMGNNCRIQNHVSIFDGVTLEDDVFIGPMVSFTNVKRPRAYKRGRYEKTLIKKGAAIGANATIICGVTIGENAFIGAGSTVTKDVPDGMIAWGNPARIQNYAWIKRDLEKIGNEIREERDGQANE